MRQDPKKKLQLVVQSLAVVQPSALSAAVTVARTQRLSKLVVSHLPNVLHLFACVEKSNVVWPTRVTVLYDG